MRLSEIGDKEIIDIRTGNRHGQLWDAEMLFDEKSGEIQSLLVPDFTSSSKFEKEEDNAIPLSDMLQYFSLFTSGDDDTEDNNAPVAINKILLSSLFLNLEYKYELKTIALHPAPLPPWYSSSLIA